MKIVAWLLAPLRAVGDHQQLIATLVQNEVATIYSGTALSYAWAIVTPLVTVTVYTFIFSGVLKSSFESVTLGGQQINFTISLFAGLVMWEFFSSVIGKSSTIVTSRPNYVKKIVFPVVVLPIVTVGASIVQYLIGYLILLVVFIVVHPAVAWRILFAPFFLVPVILYASGLSWILASIGVFFRDISNAINPILQLLWFASAIFFPISSVPPNLQWIFWVNPIAACIDQCRRFVILGDSISWSLLLAHLLLGYLTACIGLAFFRRTRSSFADVL